MLVAKKLRKTFRSPSQLKVLDGIDLSVAPKETVAIMGKSGVGKSTLLHILGTLEPQDEGELFINGESSQKNKSSLRNREIGFIFQSFFLLENHTVLDNVLMPAKIGRQSTKEGSAARLRALKLLEKLDLLSHKDHLAKTLSGGEKQRTCIARALCMNPSIIFADEPTGNLDHKTSKTIQDLLIQTVKEEGKSLILVTHDSDFAKRCDKTYQLKAGKLIPIDLSFK